jgi:hypothetical protein
LKQFANVSKKYAFETLPDQKYRVISEEIQGTKDLDKKTKPAVESLTVDMDELMNVKDSNMDFDNNRYSITQASSADLDS